MLAQQFSRHYAPARQHRRLLDVAVKVSSICVEPAVATRHHQQQQLEQQQPELRTSVPQARSGSSFDAENTLVGLNSGHAATCAQSQQDFLSPQQCQQDLLAVGSSQSQAARRRRHHSRIKYAATDSVIQRRRRRRPTGASSTETGLSSRLNNIAGHTHTASSTCSHSDRTFQDDSSGLPGGWGMHCSSRSNDSSSCGQNTCGSAWTPFHSKLLQSLRREQLLPQHAEVLVAVSGGQDSMAMLRLLQDLSTQQHWPLTLVVGHCDHRTRQDSAANAQHVREYCEQYGVAYMQAVADRQQGDWSEGAARDWRHQQLLCMAAEAGCSFIALGHTATERAETLLHNLIRGAGMTGLGAMGWSRPLAGGLMLVRPLLGFERHETLSVCSLTDTKVYFDTTNSDQRYARNRLRLSVFPHLSAINPSAVSHMCNTAEIARLEADLMDILAAKHLADALLPCRLVSSQQAANMQASGLSAGAGMGAGYLLAAGAQTDAPSGGSERTCSTTSAISAVAWGYVAVGRIQPCLAQVFSEEAAQQLPPQASTPPTPTQPQPSIEQSQHQQPETTTVSGFFVDALQVPVLLQQHPALQRRVVQRWLASHTAKAVRSSQVLEVLGLLQPGRATGDKTSTLWSDSCVLRYRQLLLLLDVDIAKQLLSGQLQLHRVSVDGSALSQTVAACHGMHGTGARSHAL